MRIFVIVLVSLFLLTVTAVAQDQVLMGHSEPSGAGPVPRAPSEPVAGAILISKTAAPKAAVPHRFFDKKNVLALSAVGVSLAGDGWSTQRALALPGTHEVNPIARPFVSSRGGEVAYSGASFALVAGGLYLAHRTHHHKWERIAPFALAGWEGLLTAWNLHVGK
jgi:hypothetical protein